MQEEFETPTSGLSTMLSRKGRIFFWFGPLASPSSYISSWHMFGLPNLDPLRLISSWFLLIYIGQIVFVYSHTLLTCAFNLGV